MEHSLLPLLSAVLNAVRDVVLVLSPSNKVVFINSAGETVFNGDISDWMGLTLEEVPVMRDVLAPLNLKQSHNPGSFLQSHRQLQGLWPDGSAYNYEATCLHITVGKELMLMVTLRDLFSQKQRDQALNESQKAQAVGALAGRIAHDFNNILTAILSHLDLVASARELPVSLQPHIAHVQTSARRGSELVGKLLNFSRPAEPNFVALDMVRLITEVVVMLRRNVDTRIQIHFDPPQEPLWFAHADESQVMQMLMYLCLNSRDAMTDGGDLSLSLANICYNDASVVPPKRPGDYVCVTVKDSRPVLPTLGFSPSLVSHPTPQAFGRGIDLGLVVAYNIVANHGGWVEVGSHENHGTQFLIYLPCKRQQEQTENQPVSTKPPLMMENENKSLEGHERVLVADDDELVRLVVQAILNYRGYDVEVAQNGDEALQKYQKAVRPFDLVLADIDMPGLTGYQLLVKLKQWHPKVPVILLSGSITEAKADPSGRYEGVYQLPKPFENIDLVRMVRRILDEAKSKE